MTTRILVIDDEEPICEILRYNLTKEGYEVDCAFSAEEALAMDLTQYQLFIVDIMMDKLSGFDFARRVKNNPQLEHTPIIFCSALDGEDETVMGLNIGADDYITKPFKVPVVIAHVRAVLRRAALAAPLHHTAVPVEPRHVSTPAHTATTVKDSHHEPDIVFRTLRINQDEKTCYIDGQPLKLTKTEFDMLLFFLTHKNKIYSRNDIIKYIWGDQIITSRAIDTNVTRLRKKLENYGNNLVTRTGFGYGFQEDI